METDSNKMAMAGNSDVFDEAGVFQKLSEGSESAFRILYEQYYTAIYRTAFRFLQNSVLAEDAVHEVFSTIWAKKEEMKNVRNPEAYLKTVARNQIYTSLRALSYETRQKNAYGFVAESSVDNCDSELLNDQNEQLLRQILNNLPVRQQEVFHLSRNEGLSHDHIAEKLNISPGTVKNHMVRALQTIRQQLSPYVDSPLYVFFVLTIKSLEGF